MKELEITVPGARGHVGGVETVWPTAALLGALASAALSGGTWLGAAVEGLGRPVGMLRWTAEHAVWGTLFAVAVALATHAVARRRASAGASAQAPPERARPAGSHGSAPGRAGPADPARERALAGRVVLLAVVCAHFAVAAAAAWRGHVGLGPLLGLVAGLVAVAAVVRLGLRCSLHLGDLPALDPVRVAVLLAAATLPVTASLSGAPPSLLPAWLAMLGG